jgi:hypothetical protein
MVIVNEELVAPLGIVRDCGTGPTSARTKGLSGLKKVLNATLTACDVVGAVIVTVH